MKVGKAKYGAKKNTFKVKDGDNVYRILPPLGNLADAGRWSQYYRVEWGFKDSDGINRPFQDCRVVNRATGMVEIESPAYTQRDALLAAKNKTVANFKAGEATKDDVTKAIDLVKRYNLDSKHYLNVVSLNGEIGLLKIGHKAKLALDSEISKLRKKGIDPLSLDNGRFFNFHRSCPSGNFRDTLYQITLYKEARDVDGQSAEFDKVHVLDDETLGRLEGEAFELSGMYPEVTSAELQEMVDGGVEAVDRILGKAKDRKTGGSASGANGSGGSKTEVKTEAKTETKTETKAAENSITKSDVAAQESEEISKTEASSPSTEEVPAGSAAGQEQSDDDFLKSIGAL